MTAMVDVAFLLLTFFILVSQFRPEEVVTVTTPSSTSDSKVPEGNLIQITMDTKGRVFFGMAGQNNRISMLENLGEARAIEFTEEEKEDFSLMENRSEEHTSELQSLMRISYAVFCLNKKKKKTSTNT